jgi:hypothetical protein
MAGQVPELLVKKRKRDDAWAAKREAAALEARKKARANRRSVPLGSTDMKAAAAAIAVVCPSKKHPACCLIGST